MPRRPCWVEISARAFEKNYRLLAEASQPVELLAIVKANAYGHGLEICAPAAARAGARWLGVTSVEEGAAARSLCPEPEILVISGPFPGQGAAVVANRLTLAVWDAWQLDELDNAVSRAGIDSLPVHLELDTGMTRQGVSEDELDAALARFAAGRLRLSGVMTHLYAADESDGEISLAQLDRLQAMIAGIHAQGLRPNWLHVGNSAAVLGGLVLPALAALGERYGMRPMARPGLALYGLVPEYEPELPVPAEADLERVLEWKTQVVTVRSVPVGASIGYNGTFVATEPIRVALLAVGYADGLKRGLSNCGEVLVRGQRAPIVGRISMDQTMVDVTSIEGVAPQDEVVLIGCQGNDAITAEDHARWVGTIPWEIFTSITARVERIAI